MNVKRKEIKKPRSYFINATRLSRSRGQRLRIEQVHNIVIDRCRNEDVRCYWKGEGDIKNPC